MYRHSLTNFSLKLLFGLGVSIYYTFLVGFKKKKEI